MFQINPPYLLFLGDAPDQLSAKTARGIKDWRPEKVVGQYRLANCQADLGIADMDLHAGWEAGARTLVLGTANRGGVLSDEWIGILKDALEMGYDIANGLHKRAAAVPELAAVAAEKGRNIFDVRHADAPMPVGTGEKRMGKRLLAVGTDCSCGKMYTALAIEKEMKARGMNATFRATGQTGILIAGAGISVDAVIADFMAGAVEAISPANDDAEHWDVIEGQGSLGHPSFSGVTAALIHGGQPDALVLCHEPTRTHMRGLEHQPLPSIDTIMDLALQMSRMVNSDARFVGLCVNTSQMDAGEVEGYLAGLEDKYGLPAVDPFAHGASKIVDNL